MSRIIKSLQGQDGMVNEFQFRPIAQAAAARTTAETDGFIRLGLFDPSEIGHAEGDGEAEEPVEPLEPPGITLPEEEFHQRLHDSFQNGLTEGKNLAERGLVNVFRSLRTAAESIQTLREKVLRESEDELIELVMLVARKVVLQEITQDRSILSHIIQAGVSSLSERDEITIRLNPDDYAVVILHHQEHFQQELLTERMHLKSDPAVPAGGCQIDSEMGMLDAGIDAQLDEIYRHLLEERKNSAGVEQ